MAAGAIAGGSAIGAGSAAVGGAIGMGVDAHVRNQNWSRQKRILQERFQWMVRDLRAAGLNPVLAATGGMGGGGAPALTGSASGGLGSSIASGLGAGAQASKASSEAKKNKATEEAATAQAVKLNEEALNAREMRPFIQAQAEKMSHDAKSAEVNLQQMLLKIPELSAMAELFTDPLFRRQMQAKEVVEPKGIIQKLMTGGAAGAFSGVEALKKWLEEERKAPEYTKEEEFRKRFVR